uniref:RRM domain-containing protein n=2 Tax=Pseudo-nitzschia australis TaxID=44445 RepID=A0A7S4AAD9_9STRA|mmetsp:Transcript_8168/g.17625  ORF Transcript_8168/g.17625 Transcript_8168/m.17625 type:complete len:847 (-) Transcript_8168:73-2613(-)
MSILERVRASGKCSPSLLCDDTNDDFIANATKVVDANELCLSSGPTVPDDFAKLLEMTSNNTESIAGDSNNKNAILISRRSTIVTIIGSTPIENSTLDTVLQNGYLGAVKLWMDDILKGTVGGIDLLLHLLTNIAQLPVTKGIVKESGMGKAVGSIEKHRICVDSPNKVAIVERVSAIKEAWKVSVKIRKDKPQNSTSTTVASSSKRDLDTSSQSSSPTAKKPKLDDTKKSSLSSLLTKVAPTSILSTEDKYGLANVDSSKLGVKVSKKTGKRLKWKDHFGGMLEASKILEEDHTFRDENPDEDTPGSWSDRKKRDRLREKELLAKAKKAKLLDDDDDGLVVPDATLPVQVQPTIAWHVPPLIPERQDASPSQNNSKEKVGQTTRMASVTPAAYTSEFSVPMNPTPLSDVEQALDMTSQSSTVTQVIPFFVPQQPVAPAPSPQPIPTSTPAYPPAQPPSGIASAETVQSLGLPPFLVGQNLQALQTLAGTPELLRSFVGSNGMYDQVRLMNLVQTLSQNSSSSGQHHQGSKPGFQQQKSMGQNSSAPGTYGQTSGHGGMYGMSSNENKYGSGQSAYGNNNNWQGNGGGNGMKAGGYRGAQNSSEGNLHLSGYGAGTTQAEIIALFSPYVHVSEVVVKATFCFVNTNDPGGAKQAREALNGALLGGQPVRINMAQRKNRDNHNTQQNGPSNTGSYYGRNPAMQPQNAGFHGMGNPGFGQPPVPPPPMGMPPGQGGGEVRDDRGNPATKNLFVAGYGQGTTEHQLRDTFAAHAQITGIISKGTFSFVNTNDKMAATRAREVLSGTMLNGGVLRINFAKETGRLGTSFDITYGGGGGPPNRQSHYGRSN